MKRYLHINAVKKPKSKTYDVRIEGGGYDAAHLRALFELFEAYQTHDEDTLITFPVIRELEDPDFLAELERRLDDVKSGKVKFVPWSEVKKALKKRLRKAETTKKQTKKAEEPKRILGDENLKFLVPLPSDPGYKPPPRKRKKKRS